MDRRLFAQLPTLAAVGLTAAGVLGSRRSEAATTPATAPAAKAVLHNHGAQAKGKAGEAAIAHEHCLPRRFDAVVGPFQACTVAMGNCIAHCQMMLADGDTSMADCLRTALDADVVCNATLRAASLNSKLTPALAAVAVTAMEACVAACKPHVEHHAECKACHDACVTAIAAARKLG